ncbi:zinc finger MYND domain-containing protein [Phanerochaete sordida]|uniref:Zinc finger MYND domain-containing protein n=1 Tax=Phanerochaete sordida TaxID=48140 RepID=A0A9P3GED7_9APHY|nr:zinc finger MYND domain-containing protein [Phanerochaete sordida]
MARLSNIATVSHYIILEHISSIGPLPEACAHATIPFVCDYLVRLVDDAAGDPKIHGVLLKLLVQCRDILRQGSTSRSAAKPIPSRLKFNLFRNTSRRFRDFAVQRIRQESKGEHEMWKSTLDIMDSLGEFLRNDELGPELPAINPFPLLKRCHRPECLCSVYKPSHRMRICAGCCKVAYCNKICQSADWSMRAPFCRKA